MDRSALSPAAPFTHAFCSTRDAEVRVFVTVHTTGTGSSGTTPLAA